MVVGLLMLAILAIGAVSASEDISDNGLGVSEGQDVLSFFELAGQIASGDIDESQAQTAAEDIDDSQGDTPNDGPLSLDGSNDENTVGSNELSSSPKTFTDLNNAINGN